MTSIAGALVRFVVVTLALIAALAACSSPDVASGPAVQEISGRMPALEGATLMGGTLMPEDYAGRVVVVNFWATSCAPCRREMPVLSAAHAASGDDGAFVVGINYREGEAAAREYLAELGIRYPSLSDPTGDLAFRFGVPYLPTTLVIDREGRLRYRVTGEVDAATLDDLVSRVAKA